MRPWDVKGADVFQLNNKNYICTVDYHNKFPVIKRMEGLSAASLIAAVKNIFVEYGIPQRIMSDAGSNFISEKFKTFCTASTLSRHYHHCTTTKAMDK